MKSKVWRPLRWPKKNLYSRPGPSAKQRSARLKFVKKNKKIILFGGRSDFCMLGDKKAQIESSRALHATWLISLNAATATECDKKTKGGCR